MNPQQTFLSDQALAHAREEAKAGALAVVIDYASGGQCSWCDCDVTIDNFDTHSCAGCPNGAHVVFRYFAPGANHRTDIPICAGHKADAIAFFQALFQTGGRRG